MLSKTSNHLDLSNHPLFKISDTQTFMNSVDALANNYLSVDMSNNSLANLPITQQLYFISKISPDLEKLKLCNNKLGLSFDQYLISFFQNFPKKLKYLYLQSNDLFNSRDDDSIANILNALPDSLNYLDVTDNECWETVIKIEERMVSIFPLLKKSIQNALNYDRDIPKFMAHKIDLMIFGKRQRYKDIQIKPSQLPFVISEFLLEKLVHLLEKTKDLSSFYLAGLLLEGKIPSQIQRDFSASELWAYCEKRMHDAITLYMKAGPFMDLPSSEMLFINFLIAKRTASFIRPCLLAQAPDLSESQPSTDSNRSFSP